MRTLMSVPLPQKATLAHRLLSEGATLDELTLATIGEPSAHDGVTGWQRLQLAPDGIYLVSASLLSHAPFLQ